MYKHILVPTDGSTLSLKAARAAGKLAAGLKSRITAIYVITPFSPPMSPEGMIFSASYSVKEYERAMRKTADKALARVKSAVGAAKFDSVSMIHTHPWEAIIKAAASRKCDLIVMASHGRRGLAGVLLGSETQKVLTHSRIPVLVCR